MGVRTGEPGERSSRLHRRQRPRRAKLWPRGETILEILHSDASYDPAYWTGLQHAMVRFAGPGEPVEMHLRIAEAIRREGGDWR